jgi:hypothetical protein
MTKNNFIKAFIKIGELKTRLDAITHSPLFDYCQSKHDYERFHKKFQDESDMLHLQLKHTYEDLCDITGELHFLGEDEGL